MSHDSQIYVRIDENLNINEMLKIYPDAKKLEDSEFYSLGLAPDIYDTFLLKEAKEFSQSFNVEVIVIEFASVSDSFCFFHCKNGNTLRCLINGMHKEPIWEKVIGEPEPWEKEAFFDNDRSVDFEPNDPIYNVVKAIYSNKIIVKGNFFPTVNAKNAAFKVMDYYNLW